MYTATTPRTHVQWVGCKATRALKLITRCSSVKFTPLYVTVNGLQTATNFSLSISRVSTQ